jgi:hypothetical protein
MEIRTSNNSYIGSESHDINDAMDAIVCALILEGHHVKTIRDALINKAEVMIEEFSFNEGGEDG